MKKLTMMLGLILMVAQASWGQTFSIQGVLKNQYGKSLPDGYYAVTFSLYDTQTGGSALWSETLPSLQTQNGMFETELGTVNPFGSLAFDRNYWLGVAVEDNTEMPRMKLLNMPYSFAAKGFQNRFPSVGNVGIGVTEPESKLSVSGDGETYVTVQSSGGEAGFAFAENGNAEWVIKRVTADSTLRVTEVGVGDVLTVQPGGNVGIGTDEPASKIHVGSGNLTVDGALTSDSDEGGLWMGDSHFIGGDGADKMGIRTGDEWSLTVTPEGKVGIGTTDPTEMLDVAGNIKISGEGAVVFPDQTSIRSLLSDFAAPAVTNPGNLLINADSDADTSMTGGQLFNTGTKTRMYLANNGNLGIGTTDPQRTLDVAGNINFSGEIKKNGIPVTTSPWLSNGNDIYYSQGQVGIGVTKPNYELDVDGYIYATGFYYLNAERIDNIQPWIQPLPEDHPNWSYISNHRIQIYLGPTIGSQYQDQAITPDPRALVQARGFQFAEWSDTFDGGGTYINPRGNYNYIGQYWKRWYEAWIGTIYAENYNDHTWSVSAKGTGVRPVQNGLETIMQLNGKEYDINTETHPFFKNKTDGLYASIDDNKTLTSNLGYVAQELKEVIPEMVEYDEETGYYLTKNRFQVLPVIVEAIKDLNAENEALEERIEKLEAGIRQLKGEE